MKYNSKTMEVLKMGINSIDAEDDQSDSRRRRRVG